eukprot:170529-Chlamydomonas_euryale.AAC.1
MHRGASTLCSSSPCRASLYDRFVLLRVQYGTEYGQWGRGQWGGTVMSSHPLRVQPKELMKRLATDCRLPCSCNTPFDLESTCQRCRLNADVRRCGGQGHVHAV